MTGSSRPGQQERAEAVGADLELEAVDRPAFGHGHDPGVVDQDVERPGPPGGERPHRGEAGQVQRPHLGAAGNAGSGALALLGVAYREDDAYTGAGQLAGDGQAEAAGGTGDDGGPPRLTGKIGGGPLHGGHRSGRPVAASNEDDGHAMAPSGWAAGRRGGTQVVLGFILCAVPVLSYPCPP
jgi:hypothetical protein